MRVCGCVFEWTRKIPMKTLLINMKGMHVCVCWWCVCEGLRECARTCVCGCARACVWKNPHEDTSHQMKGMRAYVCLCLCVLFFYFAYNMLSRERFAWVRVHARVCACARVIKQSTSVADCLFTFLTPSGTYRQGAPAAQELKAALRKVIVNEEGVYVFGFSSPFFFGVFCCFFLFLSHWHRRAYTYIYIYIFNDWLPQWLLFFLPPDIWYIAHFLESPSFVIVIESTSSTDLTYDVLLCFLFKNSYLYDYDVMNDRIATSNLALSFIFQFTTAAAMLICFFSLVSSMYTSVHEQKKEIGILLSLGLPRTW